MVACRRAERDSAATTAAVRNEISGGVFFDAVIQGQNVTVQLLPPAPSALDGLPAETAAFTGRHDPAAPCPVEVKQQMMDRLGPVLCAYCAGSEGNGSTMVRPAGVAVICVPDADVGQSVLAIVQPAGQGTSPDNLGAELIAHCRSKLTLYKAPRAVEFAADLPRTPTGRLLRRKLRDADSRFNRAARRTSCGPHRCPSRPGQTRCARRGRAAGG